MTCTELKHEHFSALKMFRDTGLISVDIGVLSRLYRTGLVKNQLSKIIITDDGLNALRDYEEVGGFENSEAPGCEGHTQQGRGGTGTDDLAAPASTAENRE